MKFQKLIFAAALTAMIASTGLLTSCSDQDDDSQIAVDITGIESDTRLYTGDNLEIKIFATTTSTNLSRMLIESHDAQQGNMVLVDKQLSTQTYNDKFYYTAPALLAEEAAVKLSFSFTDSQGYTREVSRTITVVRRDTPMEERSGVVLYCDGLDDTRADGYCFSEMRPIITGLVEPTLVDLYFPSLADLELPNPDDQPTVIRQWRTMTDLNFARSNSFDFSAATSLTIAAAYEGSVRAPRISNLQSGDIVLVGRGATAMAAIQIVDIIDNGSLNTSRYLLNIKAVKDALPYTPPVEPEEETPNKQV